MNSWAESNNLKLLSGSVFVLPTDKKIPSFIVYAFLNFTLFTNIFRESVTCVLVMIWKMSYTQWHQMILAYWLIL